ncbi:MAG: hypothetical protein AAGA71_05980 [Pseudomonadota bacterium]
MAVFGREIIDDIEQEMALPRGLMRETPLQQFLELDVEALPSRDEELIRQAFIEHLRRRTTESAGEVGVQSVPDNAAVAAALRSMRAELLSPQSSLSQFGRGFIDDHCPCP